jgi:hypothetical protein
MVRFPHHCIRPGCACQCKAALCGFPGTFLSALAKNPQKEYTDYEKFIAGYPIFVEKPQNLSIKL